jgi:hypothetical protein
MIATLKSRKLLQLAAAIGRNRASELLFRNTGPDVTRPLQFYVVPRMPLRVHPRPTAQVAVGYRRDDVRSTVLWLRHWVVVRGS